MNGTNETLSLNLQLITLLVLVLLIALLTASETALLTYKRLHATSRKERLNHLLSHTDQVITLLQLFKYFLLILVIWLGLALMSRFIDLAVVWSMVLSLLGFTLVLLLVAELLPRKLARLYPESFAYSFAEFYSALLVLAWPLVALVNLLANMVLKLCQQPTTPPNIVKFSGAELRQLIEVEGLNIPPEHLEMLISIVDLESSQVEDIMIPRHQLVGIDLAEDWADIQEQVIHSLFTRLLIYEHSVDNILGFVHLKRLLPLLAEDKLDREHLKASIRPAYFIPKGTSLIQQLLNFREQARRSAIVVDEYGDILGMLALEDILEEIVGEFSTVPIRHENTIQIMADGSAWLDGATPIRDINQALNLDLPVNGPKTINGLIMEHLELLPVPGMTVLIEQHPMEIRKTRKNIIKTLIIYPAIPASNLSGAADGKK
ncbi:CNNM domain-containing protein [Thiothrix eikelboomii]|uniref:CNNM domain-containing protein n=1 Tax=Thiothrix eikelboomii TaxID=92487 RepID=UPI003BB0A31E